MENTIRGTRPVSFGNPTESTPASERHDGRPVQPPSRTGDAALERLRTIGAGAGTSERQFSFLAAHAAVPSPAGQSTTRTPSLRSVSPLTASDMSPATPRSVSPMEASPIRWPLAWRIGKVPGRGGNAGQHGSLPEPDRTASPVPSNHLPLRADTPAGAPKQPEENWNSFLTRHGYSRGPDAAALPPGGHVPASGAESWNSFLTRHGHSSEPAETTSSGSDSPARADAQSSAPKSGGETWVEFLKRHGHSPEPAEATLPPNSHSPDRSGVQRSTSMAPWKSLREVVADVPLQAPKPRHPRSRARVLDEEASGSSSGVPSPSRPAQTRTDAQDNVSQGLWKAVRRFWS